MIIEINTHFVERFGFRIFNTKNIDDLIEILNKTLTRGYYIYNKTSKVIYFPESELLVPYLSHPNSKQKIIAKTILLNHTLKESQFDSKTIKKFKWYKNIKNHEQS